MKRFFAIVAIATAMMIVSCSEDPYQSGIQSGGENDESEELLPAKDGRVAIAYVTYYGKSIPDPMLMTHINYAFAELYVKDGVYKGFKLQGNEDRFRQVVALKKKNPNLKISLSFSHTVTNEDNSQGGGFSALAKSDEYRKAFAKDCRDFCSKWGIDGIDIDWEFPGLSWDKSVANDTSCDVENYTLLMAQLRETLGNDYLLTYAGYVFDVSTLDDGGQRYIDIRAVDPYVDWVNIMTYNMTSQAHSALNNPKLWVDCKRAVKHYTEKGIAASKLVLGVPFFGWGEVTWSYKSIIAKDKTQYKIDNWDSASSVPYVTEIATGERLCAYDNPKSIVMKGDFARGSGLKGMMSWQYDQDDAKLTLNKAMWQATMKK